MTRTTAGGRRTGVPAALLALAALAFGTGCGKDTGSGWRPPGKGEAAVVFREVTPGGELSAPDLPGAMHLDRDGESVYVDAVWNSPEDVDYEDDHLLRIGRGTATVVAHHHSTPAEVTNPPDRCEGHQPMPARELPCALPWVIAYAHGEFVMGGLRRYYLQLTV